MMHSPKRIKITDVNPHLICVLCGGYYIDATTIIECLHSFCKSCIVRYLQKNKYCPICDVQVHKTAPLLNIRSDKTLQNIVYKLVPSLFKNEMERRVAFYEKYPGALPALPEQRGEVTDATPIFFPDELLIICLEYQMDKSSEQVGNLWPKRYLHCPAALTVSHLVKLIRGKFGLSQIHHVSLFFKDDLLQDDITIMDIAYTYQCRRKMPIHLMYRILELKKKTIRLMPPIPPAKLDSATQSDFSDAEKKSSKEQQKEVKDRTDVNVEKAPPKKNNVQAEKSDTMNVIESQINSTVSAAPPGAVQGVNNKDTKKDGKERSKEVEMKVLDSGSSKESSSSDQVMESVNEKSKCNDEKVSVKSDVSSAGKDGSVENKAEQSAGIEAGTSSEGAWKEVQLQISENGVMSVRNMKSSECSPIPAVEAPNCPVSHPTATSQASSVVPSKVTFSPVVHRNTEPIVSVSKVSKDQVKKEVNHTITANDNKLSISRVSSPAAGMPVAKGDVLNRIVSKLSPNETVIGNTGVTIRPVTKVYPGMKSIQERKTRAPSNHVQSRYKTITQAPTWNPTIDRTTMLTLKQNCDLNKPPRFFKMRNTPRYLGNPAEGVKPMYGGGGGGRQEDSRAKQSPPKSPVKQPPPYTPRGQDKPPPPYTPRPAHTSCGVTAATTYLPPNPYHLLYSGFPFTGASPELIRSMCASTAYHPSLPPSISMLYNNPGLQQSQQHQQQRLQISAAASSPHHDFNKSAPTSTPPSIQRIPSSLSPMPLPQTIDDKKRDHSPASTSSSSTSSGTNKSHKPQEDKSSTLHSLPQPPLPIPLPPPPPSASPSEKSVSSLTINNNTKESLLPPTSTATINHHSLK